MLYSHPSPKQEYADRVLYHKIEIANPKNMMKGFPYLVTVAILALAFSLASAYDPSPLQDFCIATVNANSGGTYMVSLLLAAVVLSSHSFEIIIIKFYTVMKSCLMVISSTLDFFHLRHVIVHFYRTV